MPSKYDDIDEDNPGVQYASEEGVSVAGLHEKISAGVDGEFVPQFDKAELRVLKACVEVACGF